MGRQKRRERDIKTTEEKTVGRSKIAQFLEMPEGSIHNISHIEVSGNSEAMVDGCQGVLQYDENIIRINTEKMIVKFTGKRLQIKCMTSDTAIITGVISGIEFILG